VRESGRGDGGHEYIHVFLPPARTLWRPAWCSKLLPHIGLSRLIFVGTRVKEYQAVVIRLSRHLRDDEDALTDLLNERSRGGWEPAMMAQDEQRLTVVFAREMVPES
jgi:hypothetical protein